MMHVHDGPNDEILDRGYRSVKGSVPLACQNNIFGRYERVRSISTC